MTYSLNYGDLLRRQAELQRLGNMPEATAEQIEVARVTEVGELAQALKPDWAWWQKPGGKKEVDREAALGEMADVLHFALLNALPLLEDALARQGFMRLRLTDPKVDYALPALLASLSSASSLVQTGKLLCAIAAHYGFTPDDLARAYWEKSEENLRRWKAVADE